MKSYSLGRVVGSKIRNGDVIPTDFTGWLEGDIFIHNKGIGTPYYEYKNNTLILLGHLQGADAVISKIETGYVTFFVAPKDGTITDYETDETISVLQGDLICAKDAIDDTEYIYDAETGDLSMITKTTFKFKESE